MNKISRDSLMTLEAYAKGRKDFRAKVLAHKKNRIVHLGEHLTLIFEDELTIRYQVQEMLRIERIFEPEGIADELETYNALIPDGRNWKATLMLEYADPDERRVALARLKGLQDRIWVRVSGFDPVYAIANEDLERENETKTASVHFLRFELTPDMVRAAKSGADIAVGIEHSQYTHGVQSLERATRDSLAEDLEDA
jgi:Protein of unknown function (DUF3501)